MIVEPSWRIDTDKPTSADSYGVVTFEKGDSGYTVVGRLVPDTRLQTIADARSTRRSYSIEEWMDCVMLALDAATRIGEQEGTHLHYGNHDILIETGRELRAVLSQSLGSDYESMLDALTEEEL